MIAGNYLSRDITSAWKRFTTKVDIKEGVTRPEIADSWKYCYKIGVDPLASGGHLYLNQYEFKKMLDKKRNLLNITRKIISDLYYFVADSGFIIMLSDERGYIMEIMGDDEQLVNASKYNLRKGASWAEEMVGTNGIGTALTLKRPIQISGAEHYCKKNHFWTCSAAPILDSNGKIVGVLQISGPSYQNHLHTLGLVVAAVNSISNQLKLQQTIREFKIFNNRMNNVLLAVQDGIIVTDQKGVIVQVSPAAENILMKKDRELRGCMITDMMGQATIVHDMLRTGEAYKDIELTVKAQNGAFIQCLSSGRPMKDFSDTITGGIILISHLSSAKKPVNRLNGAQATFQFNDIVGENQRLQYSIGLGKIAAKSISHVLLQGESGTGKEVFAQAIHNLSSRRNKPFVAVNCGAIPRDLIGSELFGYEGGAFTGAKLGGRPGKFEQASSGTLFLDEIGDMPLEQQVALLRVLQDQNFTRIGGEKTIQVDVRIICATNKNLRLEVAKGNFRRDLFYRLNVISIMLPPLRERKEDIPLLFDLFFKKICGKLEIKPPNIDPAVISNFIQYDWPGNVRELQNVLERMLNLANGQSIGLEHLPEELLHQHEEEFPTEDLHTSVKGENDFDKHRIKELLDQSEKREIMGKILAANGNLSQTARDMGISRNTLYKKIKQLNISVR